MGTGKIFIGILCVFTCLQADLSYHFDDAKTQEEALFIRRILEFWNESEFDLAQSQIEDFLQEFPQNTYADTLQAILGDLAMKKQDYAKASAAYSEVKEKELKKRVLINQLDCIRQLQWYVTLAEECENHLDTFSEFEPDKHEKVLYFLADALYHLTLRDPTDSPEYQNYAFGAQERFEHLLGTKYALDIMQPLAHIYSLMEKHDKASSLFVALAEKRPQNREEMLFQAANVQVKYDKEQAIRTFGQVYHLGKKKAPEAAYNRMILLFETGKYGEILLAKDQLLKYIPKEKIPLVHFFLGRSHYLLEDFKRSISELRHFIDSDTLLKTELHDAYVTVIDSSIKLQSIDFLSEFIEKFRSDFPQSTKLAQAYQKRAFLYKQSGKNKLARRDFQTVFDHFPDYKFSESLLYDYAHLLFQMQDWNESREIAEIFLEDFVNNPRAPVAWRLFINASIECTQKDPGLKKIQLIPDLLWVLDQKGLLEKEEKNDYVYLLSKTHYDLGEYREALDVLVPLVKEEDLSFKIKANSYLIMANCYKKGFDNLNLFCAYAEQALKENSKLESKNQVRLALFNGYLKLYTLNSQKEALQSAAEHLYQVQANGAPIKGQNKIWLISHYHQKVKEFIETNWSESIQKHPQMLEATNRVCDLLKEVVKGDFTLEEKEKGLLDLADVFGFKKEFQKKVRTLQKLQSLHQKHPDRQWNLKENATFELAKGYVEIGKKKEALSLFNQILSASTSLQSYFPAYACLQSARLRYVLLDQNFLKKDHPEMIKIFSQLKNLTLQKNFDNEPIYLEAAIDYIDILCFEEQTENKKLQLIQTTIDEFFSEQDVLSKEYHQKRRNSPQKERVFFSYIDLLDLESMIIKISIDQGDKEDVKGLYSSAKELLEELKLISPTEYFYKRVEILEEKLKVMEILRKP